MHISSWNIHGDRFADGAMQAKHDGVEARDVRPHWIHCDRRPCNPPFDGSRPHRSNCMSLEQHRPCASRAGFSRRRCARRAPNTKSRSVARYRVVLRDGDATTLGPHAVDGRPHRRGDGAGNPGHDAVPVRWPQLPVQRRRGAGMRHRIIWYNL